MENAFGILSNRFRIYHHPMQFKTSTVEAVVLATCALHNYLRCHIMENDVDDDDHNEKDNDKPARLDVTHTTRNTGLKYNVEVKKIRDILASYFVGIGQIEYQWKHANL